MMLSIAGGVVIGVIVLIGLFSIIIFLKKLFSHLMLHYFTSRAEAQLKPLREKWKNATMEQIMKFDWTKAYRDNPCETTVIFERMAQLKQSEKSDH
ncbi:MAG: hypothetical protein PHZ00_07575 [Candidatus Peribacteraceae bacterium]|nr:hypothetical protein [Candidatus Peribacteraceae bacterium]